MKLSKSERHTAYIIMLEEFETYENTKGLGSWFCYLIWHLFGIDDNGFSDSEEYSTIGGVMRYFPELYQLFYKVLPDHHDFAKRRKILEQCIKETYDFE